jgi:hypothetical protein
MSMRKQSKKKSAPAPADSASTASADQNEIARRAYRLYEERGRVPGHDLDDWLAAEEALREERTSSKH